MKFWSWGLFLVVVVGGGGLTFWLSYSKRGTLLL